MGECEGNRGRGKPQKRWIGEVKEFLSGRGLRKKEGVLARNKESRCGMVYEML